MSARDDYTRAPLTQATYEAMCNEIDRLREQLALVSEELLHPKELTVDQHGVLQATRQDRWQQALDSMDERQVPTVLREFRSKPWVVMDERPVYGEPVGSDEPPGEDPHWRDDEGEFDERA